MSCDEQTDLSPEEYCEKNCGYYKFFCPAYAEAHREILNSTDNLEEY